MRPHVDDASGQGARAGTAGGACEAAQCCQPSRQRSSAISRTRRRRKESRRPQLVDEAFAEQSSYEDQLAQTKGKPGPEPGKFSLARVWAFARREAIELRHDTVRLTFAVFGPILLMIVFGYGISLDVNHLTFATLDFDQTATSRAYADSFRGSIYYDEHKPILNYDELDRRLRNGELRFAIEIPAGL